MLDFRELEAFVWIVKLGSFRLAAEHLHLTQPTISERIARLEDILGEPVLLRGRRPILPTFKGKTLFRQAERMLEERQAALATFHEAAEFRGQFRLGVVETIAHSWLPEYLAEMSQRFPEMTIEMEVDGTPGLRQRLLRHELDLALLMGPVESDLIVNRHLCRYPIAFIAHRDRIRDLPDNPLDILRSEVLLSFSRESIPYRDLRFLLDELAINEPRIHFSSSISTIAQLAVSRAGIGILPPVIVRDELNAGTLQVLDMPWQLPNLQFTASWPSSYDAAMAEELAAMAMQRSRVGHWASELADVKNNQG